MEYYGITDQVYYEVYVSSETAFREFEFDGYTYRHISSKVGEEINSPAFSRGIRVTTLERTVIDSIKDMDKIAGIEEVLQNISSIKKLREKRVLSYLNCLDNQFLFQKIGYIFSYQKERLGISDDFLRECQSKIGKSKRYLSRDITNGVYDSTWKLIVPENLSLKNGVIEKLSFGG